MRREFRMRSFACHRSVARVCFSTGSGAKWLSNRYAPLKRKSPTCIATAISAPRRVRFGLALASFKTSSAFVIEAPGQPKPRRGITGVPVPLPFSALRPLPRHQAADHVLKVAPVGGRRPAADRSRGTPLALGRLRPGLGAAPPCGRGSRQNPRQRAGAGIGGALHGISATGGHSNRLENYG